MITISRLFGIITLSALLAAAIGSVVGIPFAAFIDWTTLSFVLVGTLGILLVACDPADWKYAMLALLNRRAREEQTTSEAASKWFRVASRASVSSGVIAYFLSMRVVLGNGSDSALLCAGTSIAILPVAYGIILSEFLFHPMAMALTGHDREHTGSRWTAAIILFITALASLPISFGVFSGT